MSEFIHKLFTSYKERTDGDTRIGELRRIWYDSETNTFRIQLDNTPGGTIIGGGGGGDYTLPTASTTVKGGVKIDGTTITINNQVISGFSGSYTDLTNKPTIPAAQVNSDWNASSGLAQILNKPALFSGSYTDLTNKPTLFDGAYASLTGKPTLFSGSYTDLTDKPTIPSAYTLPTATDTVLGGVKIGSNITINAGVISVATPFSGSYTDLTNKPTLFSGSYTDLTNKPTLFSGSYTDLTNKPTIPTTLAALSDVNIPSPSNGQVLTYSTSVSKWIPTTVSSGGGGVSYYGSFYDLTTQTAPIVTTAYVVNIGQTAENNGVSIVSGNRITFTYPGTYEVQFSVQLQNNQTSSSVVDFWFRKNGTDIPESNSVFTVPSKQNDNGFLIAVTPYVITVAAGDYVQLVWSPDNTNTTIIKYPAQTTPTVPEAPSVILLVSAISKTFVGTDITGNSATTTKLLNARTINGVSFDGSANITLPTEIGTAVSDETTALTTGTAKITFRMPYAMTLTSVRLSCTTAPTGAALIVNIKRGGTTIFSTKPQIDINATTSVGSAVTPVISTSALTDNAVITIDIDQVGSTIAGTGLKVWLIGTR